MKQALCKAFCDTISIRDVPAGQAVSTTAASINGDPVGFYVVGPLPDGRFRLEDSGQLIPYLYATGADLENPSRKEAFDSLLAENSATFDEDTLEIVSDAMPLSQIAPAAVRFMNLLVRASELAHWNQDRVASTFKQDALSRLKERIADQAVIREGEVVSAALSDWEPDAVIEAHGRDPVALFLVQTDARAMEAMLLHADAEKYSAALSVVALLEKGTSISRRMQAKVNNRLEAVPIYDGEQAMAIDRIAVEALGRQRGLH